MEKHGIDRDQSKQPKDGKHKDAEWLREQYVEQEQSQKEMADKCDVTKSAIRNQLINHDISIRDKSDAAKIRAERYPNTWGTENIRDYNWWDDASEDERERFREWLSQERQGEDNPMHGKTGPDHHRWKENKSNSRFYQTEAWKEVRREALEKANHECEVCGIAEQLVGHHVIPLSDGGEPLDVDNVAILCRSCHMEWEGLYLRPDTRDEA